MRGRPGKLGETKLGGGTLKGNGREAGAEYAGDTVAAIAGYINERSWLYTVWGLTAATDCE